MDTPTNVNDSQQVIQTTLACGIQLKKVQAIYRYPGQPDIIGNSKYFVNDHPVLFWEYDERTGRLVINEIIGN